MPKAEAVTAFCLSDLLIVVLWIATNVALLITIYGILKRMR